MEAAVSALCHAFKHVPRGDTAASWGPPFEGYSATVEANLLEGVPLAEVRQAFENGKGQGLHGDETHPPKMAAIYSSSALVLNTFGPWYHTPADLIVNGHCGFRNLTFEAPVPHGLQARNGLDLTPPHLDVKLDAPEHVLAIESKCLECLKPEPAEFAPAYDTIADHRHESPWYRQIERLREDSLLYHCLDAAQLIKHYLGLAHSEPTKSVTLLSLFWEPLNWEYFPVFRQHRAEIMAFSEAVAGDRVRFEALSYLDLWRQWECQPMPPWLARQVERLRARYAVTLETA